MDWNLYYTTSRATRIFFPETQVDELGIHLNGVLFSHYLFWGIIFQLEQILIC